MSLKIYLAGPDVFRDNADAYFSHLKAELSALGLEGVSPLDGELSANEAPAELARAIYQANIARIAEADAVLANLAWFRGTEPDSGTAFELGYAAALKKPVFAYNVPAVPMLRRLAGEVPLTADADAFRDAEGMAVENFGLPLNLMLAVSAQCHETREAAVAALAAFLRPAAH